MFMFVFVTNALGRRARGAVNRGAVGARKSLASRSANCAQNPAGVDAGIGRAAGLLIGTSGDIHPMSCLESSAPALFDLAQVK
jgi:hypothetical protein